jgi:heptosyltransferase III
MTPRMASLVYHAGALGDFITALPAVGAWRALHPGERLILLGSPAFAPLVRPPFDEVVDASAASVSCLFSPSPAPPPRLESLLSSVTSALLFASRASALPGALARLGVREIVRQDPFPSSPVPIVDHHLSLFAGRAFSAEERVPRVTVSPEPDLSARAAVALHPGSGSPRKNWPLERFSELSRRLARDGRSVAWILGPAEAETAVPHGVSAWRGLPLPRLAGLLSACRLFVGNDSGIAHLAAAAGCPVVVLFGGSDQRVWAPRGPRVCVVESARGGMEGIGVEEVESACRKALDQE